MGDDVAKFDQLLDTAYLHRDVAFIEAAVADDVHYGLGCERGAAVWNKQQLLADVRLYDGRERNVDAVRVEVRGGLLQTSGHVQVKTLRAEGPEYQLYFVRLYRRGPTGWQLTSHEVVWRVNAAVATSPLPTRGVGTCTGLAAQGLAPPPGVFRPGDGVTLPRLLREVKPQYTPEAMRARIEGAREDKAAFSASCHPGLSAEFLELRRAGHTDSCRSHYIPAFY